MQHAYKELWVLERIPRETQVIIRHSISQLNVIYFTFKLWFVNISAQISICCLKRKLIRKSLTTLNLRECICVYCCPYAVFLAEISCSFVFAFDLLWFIFMSRTTIAHFSCIFVLFNYFSVNIDQTLVLTEHGKTEKRNEKKCAKMLMLIQ